LPKAVRKTLSAKYPKGKIARAEAVTKGEDGPVSYEVVITTEVVLNAKGKIASAKEEEDDDDDKPKAKGKKSEKDDD
jgi:hypothetical protein